MADTGLPREEKEHLFMGAIILASAIIIACQAAGYFLSCLMRRIFLRLLVDLAGIHSISKLYRQGCIQAIRNCLHRHV